MNTSRSRLITEQQENWICCQIGAREHYAVPRALKKTGCSVQLFTDVWSTPANKWMLPTQWKQRQHKEISDQEVQSWPFQAGLRAARCRLTRQEIWTEIIQHNKWFQNKVCSVLERAIDVREQPPIVFAYSYAAREIFKLAKSRGCMTVLGQIDPAEKEVRLIQEVEKDHRSGSSEWPPHSYWTEWHEECKLADVILVNSEWSKTALLEQGIDRNKLKVVPLAFEKPTQPPAPRPAATQFTSNRPFRILFLGQVILRKGIAELTEAARRLQGAPVEWRIVGGGAADLLYQLRALKNVVVTGQISRDEVAREYQKADAFILPTHSDGFALTQLEAAAYGLPIIASKNCGDVVENYENGLLLGEVSATAICDAVLKMMQAPELIQIFRDKQTKRPRFGIRDLGETLLMMVKEQRHGGRI